MLYALLCYNSEDAIGSWSKDYHDETMTRLPTTAATTLRKGREEMVIDGPFAETKEQLLGFYIIDCASLDAALDTARDLAKANPGTGSYEIRPVAQFQDYKLAEQRKPAA
jgi:hypothetical protein